MAQAVQLVGAFLILIASRSRNWGRSRREARRSWS
jgi:hypothetical protein